MHQNSDLKNPKLIMLFGVQESFMVQSLSFVALVFLMLGLNNIHLKYPHQTPQMGVQK